MRSPSVASKVVIVCALKEEFAAVESGLGTHYRERFELIRAGVGHVSATKVAKELAARAVTPKWVVSTGFCGGLAEHLKVGDVLVGGDIMGTSQARAGADFLEPAAGHKRSGGIEHIVFDMLHRQGLKPYLGRMICTMDAVVTVEQKRSLGKDYRAQSVDMESYALVSNSNAQHTRVMFMRTVSDCVTDELPAEVGEFLNERGNVRIGKITRFIVKKPGNITRLMELKRRSDIAAKALTEAWRAIRELEFD